MSALRVFADGSIEYEGDYPPPDHDCPDYIGVSGVICRQKCARCGHDCAAHSYWDGEHARCVEDIATQGEHDTCHCPGWSADMKREAGQ